MSPSSSLAGVSRLLAIMYIVVDDSADWGWDRRMIEHRKICIKSDDDCGDFMI